MFIKPSLDIKELNFGGGNGLVRKSASCSSVEMGSNLNIPFCTFSLTKWQSISKCLVLLWNTGLEAMCIALWLSQYNVGSLTHLVCKSFKRYKSHWSSQVAVESALYSASDEDLDTVYCFLARRDIKDEPRKKQKPIVDLLESMHPAQSAST
jgi:hypothetical protein